MSSPRKIDQDRDRVTVLLLINSLLIKKAYNIYVTILSNQQTIQRMLHQSRQNILDQYNNLNRRLQCNLSVLSYINDLYHNKAAAQQPNRLQFPVILTAPVEMPELKLLYKRLHDLYPEAIQFLKMKIQQMKQQQLQQPVEFQGRQVLQGQQQPQGQQSQLNQQQAKQFQVQHQQQMPIQQQVPLQQQQRPPHPQLQLQKQQQQSFSQFSMGQGQSHQQFNSPPMNVPSQRSSQGNGAPINPLISQQPLKGFSLDPVNKDLTDTAGFSASDVGSGNFQMDSINQNGQPMLISPQQILLQQGGNNEFSMGFF